VLAVKPGSSHASTPAFIGYAFRTTSPEEPSQSQARPKSPHPVCLKGRTYFFYAAFCFAQRLRCASAILFLPAADMVLFFGTVGSPDVLGRSLRLVEAVPARRLYATVRRAAMWEGRSQR
jgi:hypothetical protein